MLKFLFDLDGTLTKQETLPLIARHFRIEGEIASITAETVAGHIPFAESLRRRVGLLGQLPVTEVAALLENVELHPLTIKFMQGHRQNCHVVTGNLSCWTQLLLKKIGCPYHASVAQVKNNRVTKLRRILNKEKIVRHYMRTGHQVVFVGDGGNDAAAMRAATVPIAAALTHTPAPATLAAAHFVAATDNDLCNLLRNFERQLSLPQ